MSDLHQTLALDPTRLKEFSYLAKAAGPKSPFDMVLVKWRKGQEWRKRQTGTSGFETELRFLVSTDYMIVTRTWTDRHTDGVGLTAEDGSESGSVFLPASWWWTGFQGAAKAIGRAEAVKPELVLEPTTARLVIPEVGYDWSTDWSRPAKMPNWRKWLARLDADDEWNGTLPSFNGDLLKTAVSSLGLTKKELMATPISLRSTRNGHDADVNPMLLVAQQGEWKCLLMPVRMADRVLRGLPG